MNPELARLLKINFKKRTGRSKFKAVKTVVNGIKFASKLEANRYKYLKFLEKNGEIFKLELQPVYIIHKGKKHTIKYIADFRYLDQEGREVIEDTKGVETPVFKIKKKLFEDKFPEKELRIIKK